MSDARSEKGPDEPASEVPKAAPSPASVPDGGLQAWLTVAGASLALFVSFGWVNCIGLFQAEYETNQLKHYSSSDVSWITSMECKLLCKIFAFLSGRADDSSFLHAFHFPRGGQAL